MLLEAFCKNDLDFVFSPIIHMQTSWKCRRKALETWVKIQNLGHFYKKPLEVFAYAIYIERRNPFRVCYLIYLSMGCEWGRLGHPWGEDYLNLGRFA